MIATLMGLDTISPRELHQLIPASALFIFDVNSPQSWMQTRVPGAVHLDPITFSAADLPADRNALIVFYCSNTWCRKAPNAARRAGAMGYTNVRVMQAGIKGWVGANLPVGSGAHL